MSFWVGTHFDQFCHWPVFYMLGHLIYGLGYEEWYLRGKVTRGPSSARKRPLFCALEFTLLGLNLFCSLSKWTQEVASDKRTLLSNHYPLLSSKAIYSVRHWREEDAIFESCKA